jgi:hypothetical protein
MKRLIQLLVILILFLGGFNQTIAEEVKSMSIKECVIYGVRPFSVSTKPTNITINNCKFYITKEGLQGILNRIEKRLRDDPSLYFKLEKCIQD